MPAILSEIIDCYPFRRGPAGVEFLLLRRAAAAFLGDTWQAVHGHIEPNEPAWQAALRELKEETGLRPRRFWQLEHVNTFYVAQRDAILMCPSFAAEIEADAVVTLSAEHTAYEWVAESEIAQRLMWPGQRAAIAELQEYIVKPSLAEPHLRIQFE
ncbi:MAG: NUDIX pyrophosphatase [Phycisphaerae bacterium]|nr:NUDIX pyrophosphatase [Phycisphaerae bacterium]